VQRGREQGVMSLRRLRDKEEGGVAVAGQATALTWELRICVNFAIERMCSRYRENVFSYLGA
jgi:hypothetical protein